MCIVLFWVPILCKKTLTRESICESSTIYNVIQRDFRHHAIDKNTIWWKKMGLLRIPARDLRGQIPGGVKSKNRDWPLPPRFPNLTVCTFFFWGFSKDKIWNVPLHHQPNNLRQFREAILTECTASWTKQQSAIQRSFDTMVTSARRRRCINDDGQAFPNKQMCLNKDFSIPLCPS